MPLATVADCRLILDSAQSFGLVLLSQQLFTEMLTSPHLPTTSLMSFLPSERSTMHLLTALLLLSGVRSSSAILTQPRERTANRMGYSPSFWGAFDSSLALELQERDRYMVSCEV